MSININRVWIRIVQKFLSQAGIDLTGFLHYRNKNISDF